MERIQEIERRYEEYHRCLDIVEDPPTTLNAGVEYNDACLSLDTIRLQMPDDIEYLLAENKRLRKLIEQMASHGAFIDHIADKKLNVEALREEGKEDVCSLSNSPLYKKP